MNEDESSSDARSKMIPRLVAHVYNITQNLLRAIKLYLLTKIGFT